MDCRPKTAWGIRNVSFLILFLMLLLAGGCDGWEVEEYYLEILVNKEEAGSVQVDPSKEKYPEGTQVELTAVAQHGWKFSHWNEDVSGEEETLTLTMEKDLVVKAFFERDNFELEIEVEGQGEVEQEVLATPTATYPYQTVVKLTASPEEGWVFEEWKGEVGDPHSSPTTVAMDDDRIITVVFSEEEFNIQQAIDEAEPGDEVEVPPGIHYGHIVIEKEITLISQYPDQPEKTIIRGNGEEPVIMIAEQGNKDIRIEGLTLEGGGGDYGGGLTIFASSPYIADNLIRDNRVGHSGGGIVIAENSSPIITGNEIRNNHSEYLGGGIAIENSSPMLKNNEIRDNSCQTSGGGLVMVDSTDVVIKDNLIKGNASEYTGGGLAMAQQSEARIKGNTIENNHSADAGAGILITGGSDPTLEDNELAYNWNFYVGGAVAVGGESQPRIWNNKFNNNLAYGLGGAIFVVEGSQIYGEDEEKWPEENSPPAQETTNKYQDNEHGGEEEGRDVYFFFYEDEEDLEFSRPAVPNDLDL